MNWFKLGNNKTKDPVDDSGNNPGQDPEATSARNLDVLQPPAADATERDAVDESRPVRKVPDALADLFLVMEEHLNPLELEDTKALLGAFQERPPLLERFGKGLQEPADLTKAIATIADLGDTVLGVANSPAFSLDRDITDVDTLIAVMGTTAVKGLVLQSAITQSLRLETTAQKMAYMRIWQSSYVATVSAHAFAELLGLKRPSIHATRALLVSLGDLALITSRPDLASTYAPKSRLIDRIEAQQHAIMANTAILSSLLVREWGLADRLSSALRHSCTPLTWAPEDNHRSEDKQRESMVLYLACRVGDAVAYDNLRDVREIDLTGGDSDDVFFVPDYIQKLQLNALSSAFDNPQTYREVQQIVDAVAPPL